MTKEELEKEAEENVMREDVITENDKVPFDNGYGFQTVSFEDEVKKGFQDGAEFGYNKGYHDAEEHYMNVIDNQHKLVDERNYKTKEIIRQLCSMVRELNKPNVQLTNVDYSLAEAEQFISEVEK